MITFIGCETTDDVANSLAVSPSSSTIQKYPQSITFTVGGSSGSVSTGDVIKASSPSDLGQLALPLTWAVSDPNLGQIAAASGNTAVYKRTRSRGINIITVTDQYGLSGIATVKQETENTSGGDDGDVTLTLSATPTSIPNGQNQSILRVVSSGSSPYTWSLLSGNGAFVAGQGTSQVTFQSSQVGDNLIQATDSNSRKGEITVTQQGP